MAVEEGERRSCGYTPNRTTGPHCLPRRRRTRDRERSVGSRDSARGPAPCETLTALHDIERHLIHGAEYCASLDDAGRDLERSGSNTFLGTLPTSTIGLGTIELDYSHLYRTHSDVIIVMGAPCSTQRMISVAPSFRASSLSSPTLIISRPTVTLRCVTMTCGTTASPGIASHM